MDTPKTDQELAATEIADELMRPTKAPSVQLTFTKATLDGVPRTRGIIILDDADEFDGEDAFGDDFEELSAAHPWSYAESWKTTNRPEWVLQCAAHSRMRIVRAELAEDLHIGSPDFWSVLDTVLAKIGLTRDQLMSAKKSELITLRDCIDTDDTEAWLAEVRAKGHISV